MEKILTFRTHDPENNQGPNPNLPNTGGVFILHARGPTLLSTGHSQRTQHLYYLWCLCALVGCACLSCWPGRRVRPRRPAQGHAKKSPGPHGGKCFVVFLFKKYLIGVFSPFYPHLGIDHGGGQKCPGGETGDTPQKRGCAKDATHAQEMAVSSRK